MILWFFYILNAQLKAGGIPERPRYNTKTRPTNFIDATCKVVNDPDAEVREMWKSL